MKDAVSLRWKRFSTRTLLAWPVTLCCTPPMLPIGASSHLGVWFDASGNPLPRPDGPWRLGHVITRPGMRGAASQLVCNYPCHYPGCHAFDRRDCTVFKHMLLGGRSVRPRSERRAAGR